jgi:hypothetical protein
VAIERIDYDAFDRVTLCNRGRCTREPRHILVETSTSAVRFDAGGRVTE